MKVCRVLTPHWLYLAFTQHWECAYGCCQITSACGDHPWAVSGHLVCVCVCVCVTPKTIKSCSSCEVQKTYFLPSLAKP